MLGKWRTHLLAGWAVVATVGVAVLAFAPRSSPQSCLDALRYADDGFNLTRGAMTSAVKFDVAGGVYYNGQLNELVPRYNEAKAACRG